MNEIVVLKRLAEAGIFISIEGEGNLAAEPASSLTDELRSMLRANKTALLEMLAKQENYEERAAVMEFDGRLNRPAAEHAAHHLVFCRDCVHHIPQPDAVSRTGAARATPGGCALGLIAPDSWPPIYSFTGWCCPRHTKIIKGLVVTAGQA